jgi:hypothetical protein
MFVSEGPRFKENPVEVSNLGPGCYDIEREKSKSLAFVPFNSKVKRNTNAFL